MIVYVSFHFLYYIYIFYYCLVNNLNRVFKFPEYVYNRASERGGGEENHIVSISFARSLVTLFFSMQTHTRLLRNENFMAGLLNPLFFRERGKLTPVSHIMSLN